MTPAPNDDELVSAVLDGEATPEEEARVRSDPALAARLEELRGVATAIAAPVAPLDELTSARLRGAALDAASAHAPTASASGRTTRRAGWRTGSRVAVAAAIVVALGVAGAFGSAMFEDDPAEFANTSSAIDGDASPAPGAASDAASDEEPAGSPFQEPPSAAAEGLPGSELGEPGVGEPDGARPPEPAVPVPSTTVPLGDPVVPVLEPPATLDEAELRTWAEAEAVRLGPAPADGGILAGEALGVRSAACPAPSGRAIGISDGTWGTVPVEVVIWQESTWERIEATRGSVPVAVVVWRSTFGAPHRFVTATDPVTCEVLATVTIGR